MGKAGEVQTETQSGRVRTDRGMNSQAADTNFFSFTQEQLQEIGHIKGTQIILTLSKEIERLDKQV